MFRIAIVWLAVFVNILHLSAAFNSTADPRIVGGTETDIKDVPYQAQLFYQTSFRCGAAIICKDYALTAAHCYTNTTLAIAEYMLQHGVDKSGITINMIPLLSIHVHPEFTMERLDSDVAVLKLAFSITFLSVAKPIRLPSSEYPPGTLCKACGFGVLSEDATTASKTLQCVDVPLRSLSSCNATYSGFLTNNMVCAGFQEGGKDTCYGDSGGALNCGDTIYGITSFGEGCAREGRPGVYTNVYHMLPWILSKVNCDISY